jgi:hypothetical protein
MLIRATLRKMVLIMALMLCPAVLATQARTALERPHEEVDRPCLRSKIRFDVSSVEKIILEPEKILAEPARFWHDDEAYRLLSRWHERIGQPPGLKRWQKQVAALQDIPLSERENHPQLIAARNLVLFSDSFASRAVKFLCDFLPPEADLTTTLYFTTEMISAGFQESGKIVIHIQNHKLVNLFVHELFHKGHASLESEAEEPQAPQNSYDRMYFGLQSEGEATYVGYMARSEFPQVGEVGVSLVAGDYAMLENPEQLRRLHLELNRLLQEAPELDSEVLRKRSWELGVQQRAYYVIGALMARTIDEKSGRQTLIETFKAGPRSFLAAYNALVEHTWKIVEI